MVYIKNIEVLNYIFSFFYRLKHDSIVPKDNPVITSEKLRNSELDFSEFIEDVFSRDDKIIFTTNAITTGISILNKDVGSIFVFNVTDSDEIIQLTSRFRNVKDLDVHVFLDERKKVNKDRYEKKMLLNDDDLKDIKKNFKSIRKKNKSDFNQPILQTIRKKQLNLNKSRFHHIKDYMLEKEIKKFPGYTCSSVKTGKGIPKLKDKKIRSEFFKKSTNDNKPRHILTFDLNIVPDGIGQLYSFFGVEDMSSREYNDIISAFSVPSFFRASKTYFEIRNTLDYVHLNLLLSNWQYLKTTNANDFLKGILANYYLYEFFLKQISSVSDYKELISKNYSIYNQLFEYSLSKAKFKQSNLSSKYRTYKFVDNSSKKILLLQKDFANIVKGMFEIEKKVKVKNEYFLKFKQPSFTNAAARINKDDGFFAYNNHRYIQSTESKNEVLYIYKLTKNDDYELIKEKSKILVSKSDIIKNITKKYK